MPRPLPAPADRHDRSSSLARSAAWLAAWLATAVSIALALQALLQPGAPVPATRLLWLLVLGMACTAAAVAWMLWRQRDLDRALRDARFEADRSIGSVDAWRWRSDRGHRLVECRPPPNFPAGSGAAVEITGQPMWEQFGADPASAATLRARLEGGSQLDGLKVWRRLGAAGREQVALHGAALRDAQGHVAGYSGTARIVVEEDASGEHDGRLKQVLLDLPVPVLALGGRAGAPTQVQGANAAASKWLGLQPAQCEGLPFAELLSRLPPDLRLAVTAALTKAEGAEPAACAGWQVRALRITPLRQRESGPQGADDGWMLTLVPTTTGDHVDPPSSGAEHESFSYTVSHDLRAPIRVVEGFTKILKEDYGRQLDRIGNDHLDRVLGAAARMNSMIDALLALSQLSSRPLSRQPVNLSQLAGYVVDDLRRQAPERVVTVNIEAGLQTQGDPTLLRVVLENLLGNAWKYSAKKPNAQIWLERQLLEGQVVYTVRDNGAGFDMRFADRLFGVFQRLHSANDFPGTGIGLASVRRIVGRHGGEIWAESAVDRGSSFHFTLPAGNPAL